MPYIRPRQSPCHCVRLARIAIERVRAEEALLGSEARFRELAENVEDVFYNCDVASGRMLYISPAYAALWGRSLSSLYDDPGAYHDAVHPEDQARVDEATDADRRPEFRA